MGNAHLYSNAHGSPDCSGNPFLFGQRQNKKDCNGKQETTVHKGLNAAAPYGIKMR
jgi:hypothetical protein